MLKKVHVCLISARDPESNQVYLDLHIGYVPNVLPVHRSMVSHFEVDNAFIHLGSYEDCN